MHTLVEIGVLIGGPGAYHHGKPLNRLQVHATVQAVLAARIDRLPAEEKRLLQNAAVIGTDVPLSLLRTIADFPEEVLHRGLAHLQAAEFLYETQLFPDHEYTFKHALTHEVAYSSLLQEQRRLLHARIVEALDDPRRLGQVCRFLSDYFYLGGAYDQAIAASQRALAEHALARAGAHQQRGRQAYDLRLLGEIGAQRKLPEVEKAEVLTAKPSP